MPSYLDKVQKQVTTAMAASSSAPEAACRCQFSDNSNNILGCDTSRSTCVCVAFDIPQVAYQVPDMARTLEVLMRAGAQATEKSQEVGKQSQEVEII